MKTRFSVDDIRPEALLDEQARLYAEDVARLLSRRDSFVEVVCPACSSVEHEPALEKLGMRFVSCVRCGTLYASPRPTPEQLEEYYQTSKNYEFWSKHIYPASADTRREKIVKPRVAQILRICDQSDLGACALLEVGAGSGIFCDEAVKTGRFERVVAVEPTPNLAEDCRRLGLTVIEKVVERIQPEELGRIDVIASFELIEHLFSPREFLTSCAALLPPGGLVVITCPNVRGFDIVMLRAQSTAIDTQHLNLFHPGSLSMLLEACGFDVVEASTPGRLDAELVRKKMLDGGIDAGAHPFLKHILLDRWEEQGGAFQDYLSENGLSSHMLLVGRRR